MDYKSILNKEKNPVLSEYEKAAIAAFAGYTDKDLAQKFFDLHEQQKECNIDFQSRYLQLKYFHGSQPWKYLSELGKLFLEQNRSFAALMCFLESLRLNPSQQEIFELALSIEEQSRPKIPETLRKDSCLVSVIVPTLGRSEEMKACVKSILDQTLQDFEIIVVNDGGWEGAEDVLKAFNSDKIRYIRTPTNGGIAKATNLGLLEAQGKYIAYLDDDDVYYPDHLETMVNLLENSNYIIGYANVQEIEGKLVDGVYQRQKVSRIRDVEFDRNLLLKRVYQTPGSTLHERSIIKEIGLQREDLPMSVDWEYWLRCSQLFDSIHISKCTTEWRKKEDNFTRRDALAARFFAHLVCMYYGFYQGKAIFAKCYLESGEKNKAKELYDEFRSRYLTAAKADFMYEDLVLIAHQLGDGKFLRILARDYFNDDPKACTKLMLKLKSGSMLLGIIHKLPIQMLKAVTWRIIKLLKR